MSVLRIEQLCFSYKSDQVLDHIEMSLDQGERVGVMGPSGHGKSTLLSCIAGFLRPSKGRIELGNTTLCSREIWVPPERRGIGMMLQGAFLFPHLNARQNIEFGIRGPNKKGVASEWLDLIGLTDFAHHYPHQLSGGQQQRVSIARTLAPRPSIVLFDEPLTALDSEFKQSFMKDLTELLEKERPTCLIVSHDPQVVQKLSNRVVKMKDGRLETPSC